MTDIWLLLKVVHVAAVITWIGGLLLVALSLSTLSGAALPVLPQERRWLLAVQRWERRVTTPAMLLAWVAGIAVASRNHWFGAGWLSVKLVLVFLLSALHGVQAGTLRRLLRGSTDAQVPRLLRLAPQLALVCTTAIVALVVLKPF